MYISSRLRRRSLSVSFCPGVGEDEGGAEAKEKAKAEGKNLRRMLLKPVLKSRNQRGQRHQSQSQSRRESEAEHRRQAKALARRQKELKPHRFQRTLPMSPPRKNPRARALKPCKF